MNSIKERYLNFLKSSLCASLYDESAWRTVDGPMRQSLILSKPLNYMIGYSKRFLVNWLRKRNLILVRTLPYRTEIREKGLDWPLFGYTMIGRTRLDNIQTCIETILKDKIPGDLMETGVWRGGAVILMKAILNQNDVTDRKVWCADSFEGLPKPNDTDKSLAGISDFSDRRYLAVSQEQVEANFSRFDLLDKQVVFLKGWFCDTLPNAPIKQLALLRLDGDLYESTIDTLTHIYPKLSPGGFVLIDDYKSWAGCRQAVDQYRHEHSITAEMIPIDNHAVYWRVPEA